MSKEISPKDIKLKGPNNKSKVITVRKIGNSKNICPKDMVVIGPRKI